jgi:hypothetical protein
VKKPRVRREPRPAKPVAPNPSDLKRPAPNEPVRIQPPVPSFARNPARADRDEETEPNVDADAREAEMDRERSRLRNDPERRRAGDRSYDVNRWVHQRANQPRGGRWQMHGHSTMRGR